MGREVKRVPLDFDWPLKKRWYGYVINKCLDGDHNLSCDDCRKFAEIKNIKLDKLKCPDIEILEVPKGEGWQMWEITSEGSPMSPVFDTPEKLAKWLSDNKASVFGYQTATYDQWLGMIKNSGFAVSMVMNDKKMMSGVEYESKVNKENK